MNDIDQPSEKSNPEKLELIRQLVFGMKEDKIFTSADKYILSRILSDFIKEYGKTLSVYPEPEMSIKCHICGKTSYNPNDVKNKYCGYCKVFHSS
jgi:ribosomal protein S27E